MQNKTCKLKQDLNIFHEISVLCNFYLAIKFVYCNLFLQIRIRLQLTNYVAIILCLFLSAYVSCKISFKNNLRERVIRVTIIIFLKWCIIKYFAKILFLNVQALNDPRNASYIIKIFMALLREYFQFLITSFIKIMLDNKKDKNNS